VEDAEEDWRRRSSKVTASRKRKVSLVHTWEQQRTYPVMMVLAGPSSSPSSTAPSSTPTPITSPTFNTRLPAP
jgi:hypothetical protein